MTEEGIPATRTAIPACAIPKEVVLASIVIGASRGTKEVVFTARSVIAASVGAEEVIGDTCGVQQTSVKAHKRVAITRSVIDASAPT